MASESETELINLSWNEFQNSTIQTFKNLHANVNFSDVTLACKGGKQLKAHKVILSSSSPFFREILLQNPHNHPLLYLKGVDIEDLTSLMKFIYSGEVEISNDCLGKFLDAANELQVDGLLHRGGGVNRKKRSSNQVSANKADQKTASSNLMEEIESKILNMTKLASMSNKDFVIKKEVEEVEDEDINEIAVELPEVVTIENCATAGFEKYKCQHCHISFPIASLLNKHIRKWHSVQNQSLKDNLLSPKASTEPWNMVNNSPTCEYCKKEFTTLHSKTEHVGAVHEMIKYLCNYCDQISSSKRNLRGHINKKHPDKGLPLTYTSVKANDSDTKSPMKLNVKDKKLSNSDEETKSLSIPSFQRNKESEESEIQHLNTDDQGLKNCDQCDFTTMKRKNLVQHVRRIHTSKI